jgi:hypothetical protein
MRRRDQASITEGLFCCVSWLKMHYEQIVNRNKNKEDVEAMKRKLDVAVESLNVKNMIFLQSGLDDFCRLIYIYDSNFPSKTLRPLGKAYDLSRRSS